jgi:hypothetical protein
MWPSLVRKDVTQLKENLNPASSPPGDMSNAMDSSGDSSDSNMRSISSGDSDRIKSLDQEGALSSIIN